MSYVKVDKNMNVIKIYTRMNKYITHHNCLLCLEQKLIVAMNKPKIYGVMFMVILIKINSQDK